MKPLELVVPGLCGPLPDLEGLTESPAMDALARLLARADKSHNAASGFHPQLARLFGMDENTAIPSAALSLLAYGYPAGEEQWLHADPVHLQADMDHAVLRDSHSLDISPADAEALVAEINNHFRDDGIYLHAVDHNHWFLNIGERNAVTTTALHDVIGRNVNFFLPRGRHEKFFKSFMNEVQMLLHMSKVNHNREQSGLLPVNSLWLWGEGELPVVEKSAVTDVYSNHPLVKGLAEKGGARYYPVSDPALLLEVINDKSPVLMVFDDLFNIACYGDVRDWQGRLQVFFEDWLEPLVSRAIKNKMPVNLYPCNGTCYTISAAGRYRIFRRGNIREHLSIHE